MKNLNEKLGAKLDRTKLSAGADESDLLFEYKSEPIENLPYNILKAGENACKIITFCDKIGSTMRDVSCGLRGIMSDKTKGKSEENGSILNDLCGAEKNKSKGKCSVSKMSGSGKIGVQKSESEKNSGEGVKEISQGESIGLKEQIANGQSLCDAEEVERESVRRKFGGVSDSESLESESEKSGSGRKNLRSNLNKDVGNGSYYKASHFKNDFSGSVTDEKENFQNVSVENESGRAGREKCVKLSDAEKREIRELARLRVAEMQKMEEGVHPVFMRGATRVLSDKDKIRLENEYVKFGLRAKNENAEAGEEVNCGSESANQNGESVLVDASERNDVRFGKGESVELGNDINVVGNGEDTRLNNGSNIRIDNGEGVKLKSKCPIDFLGNGNKGVSYNSKQKNLDDGFSYVGSSLKGVDEYEQVSKCILCSPNVAYGESVDDEYAKNDLVSYGRLVFDNSDNVNKDLDGDLERTGKVSNKNLDGKKAGVSKLMSRSEEKIGANVKTSVDEKLGAGRVDNSGFESENVGKCKSNANKFKSSSEDGNNVNVCGVSKSAVGNTTSVGEMVENAQVESFVDRDLELQEKSKRKKGKAKAYIVGAGDVNDCFPAGKFDNFDRKMVLNASVIGLDEEFIPMEVKNCELLNMRLDKRDVKFWGEKEWAKFFIKVDPCLNMCIDYCDRLVEKMVMLGGFSTESMAYGSAENMFNDMIDLIERKKMYLRLKKFVDRLKKELDAVDEKIIAYFVFGENTKDELLEIMSRRTVYRRASKIIKKLADFCVARGYTASWLYEKFGMVV